MMESTHRSGQIPQPNSSEERNILWVAVGILAIAVICVGLFLLGMGQHPEATHRFEVISDLKHIGLVYQLKANADPHNRVPPVAIVDEDGRPLLSWRVLLLPQLDEQKLFEKFDLTKPWDSPENLPLVKQMPHILASRYDRATAKQGKTPYKAIVSDDPQWNTAWPKQGEELTFAKFKDGLSSTAIVVEDLTDPVIWTKPEEITPSEYLQTLDHGQWSSKFFLIGFADGSVREFKDPTEEEVLPLLYADDSRVPEN
ncbi:DUF1559 family PulG-like putative transporter [Bremerella alba]|uniref:DUF1559 domain-containing protein n=1 Tax=Bremerella alba TaxID=980252 RepID=A0A7V9A6V6_9BACT|nr:DUF1559 domain-containing protein [Bremerella alba]MBA2114770.1 hypothetical protein [Bremerella alba]